jgi:hypothetical protein
MRGLYPLYYYPIFEIYGEKICKNCAHAKRGFILARQNFNVYARCGANRTPVEGNRFGKKPPCHAANALGKCKHYKPSRKCRMISDLKQKLG